MSIIQNAVYVPVTKTWYYSGSLHSFIEFTVAKNGKGQKFFIDGGHDYIRRNFWGHPLIEDWSLYSHSSWDEILDKLLWGTYGKTGSGPLQWVPFKQLTEEHLTNILRTQPIDALRIKVIQELLAKNNFVEKNCGS